MYIRRLKKLLILAFAAAIFSGGFLGGLGPPTNVRAETRPTNCFTPLSGGITGAGNAYYYRCVTLSPGGATLHIWDGNQSGAAGDAEYVYVATTDWGPRGDIAPWVYRSNKDPDYYIAVGKKIFDTGGLTSIYLSHHFRKGSDIQWDQYAEENQQYNTIKIGSDVPNLPDYENAFSDGVRFVWNVIANGEVKFNNETIAPDEATVQLLIDAKNGPALSEIHRISDKFEFSETDQRGGVWINDGTVNEVNFYVRLEKNNKKYEKYLTKDVWEGFTNAGRINAKLAHLGIINFSSTDEVADWTRKTGGEKTLVEEEIGAATCGVISGNIPSLAIASVLCAFLRAMGGIGEWLINTLGIKTVINAYLPANPRLDQQSLTAFMAVSSVHAATPTPTPSISAYPTPNKSSIKEALNGNPPWVLKSWKIILGLADVFIVIVLLFLAITNILHIQYDTYALKKSLPTLILGIILANFSIFITKMFVDATNALTGTFTGGDAGEMIKNLINAIIPNSGQPSFIASTPDLFSLILAILFSFVAIVAFLILGFLFYVRYAVILTLTVAAPLAFVLMAFPPTQGLFKQWWGWYAKFIFMKPISLFLLWLAWMVLDASGGRGITVWAVAVFLVYAAIIVPFKMGGAVMGAWGGLGKKLASGAAAPVKKAAQAELDYRKKTLGGRFNRWLNESTPVGGLRARRREELKTVEEQLKGSEATASARLGERTRARHMLRRRRSQRGSETQEAQDLEMTGAIEAGEGIESLSGRDYRRITGMDSTEDIARDYMNASSRINTAKTALEKRRDIDVNSAAMRDVRNHMAVVRSMQADLAVGHGINITRHDSEGNEQHDPATGAVVNEDVTYASLINLSAEYRLKAKTARDQASRDRLDGVAAQYENQANTYRHANADRYDYDAILDRNTIGRRFKEINPRIIEEADVTFKSSTGQSVVTAFNEDGYGTAEYRGTVADADRAFTGDWATNETTANFAVKQQIHAVNTFMTQGVRSGDIEGLEAMNGFVDRINAAHTNQGTGIEYKRQLIADSVAAMDPVMGGQMRDILAQRGGHANWAAAVAAGAGDAVLDGANLTQLQVLGPDAENRAQRQFAERVLRGLHADENLGLGQNPAGVVTQSNASAHPSA